MSIGRQDSLWVVPPPYVGYGRWAEIAKEYAMQGDGFTIATAGTAGEVSSRPATPIPVGDKAPAPDLHHEMVLLGEDMGQALAHIAAMVPSLAPLMAIANRIKAKAAALRAAITPPEPPTGPQPDHS